MIPLATKHDDPELKAGWGERIRFELSGRSCPAGSGILYHWRYRIPAGSLCCVRPHPTA